MIWLQTDGRPHWLERETQTKPRHEWVDGVERIQIAGAKGGHFTNYRLCVGGIEEVDDCHQVPAIEDEVARETQIQHIHAGQTQDSGRLENDRLVNRLRRRFAIQDRIGLCGLQGIAGVVLEVDAGTESPWQLVSAVHFEDVSGIKVQVVVSAVDVEVGVGKIIRVTLIRIAAAVHAFLPLDGEAAEQLPSCDSRFTAVNSTPL